MNGAAKLVGFINCDVVNFETAAVFEGVVPLLVCPFIKVIDELIPCTLQAWVFDFWAVGDFPDPEAFEAGGGVSAFAVSLYFVAGGGAVEVPVLEVEIDDLHDVVLCSWLVGYCFVFPDVVSKILMGRISEICLCSRHRLGRRHLGARFVVGCYHGCMEC